jgi:uncharacterized ParB-like nuclease family protein
MSSSLWLAGGAALGYAAASGRGRRAPHPHSGKTHTVYRDRTSKKKQPPGHIGDPRLGKLLGWEGGEVTMPATAGVHDTPLAHLRGVPVQTLDDRNTQQIVTARKEGAELPPIDLEVTGDGRVYLIDGHHRLSAAREAGDSSIRVNWIYRKSLTTWKLR